MIRHSTVSKVLVALFAVSAASPAFAARPFAQKHPRRAEVNGRVKNQERRINQGVKNGTMTKEEAHEQRQDLRNIKREERTEVKANGGHLTKSEQKDLNKQLNANSKDIYQDKHNDVNRPANSAAAPVAAPAPEAPAAAPVAQ